MLVDIDLALNVLERGLAEWLESSVESSFDICENVTKPEDCKEDIMGEVT